MDCYGIYHCRGYRHTAHPVVATVAWQTTILCDRNRWIYNYLGALRIFNLAGRDSFLPRVARTVRWWMNFHRTSDYARHFSCERTWQKSGAGFDWCNCGAQHRPNARRHSHRCAFLELDLLYQYRSGHSFSDSLRIASSQSQTHRKAFAGRYGARAHGDRAWM